MASKLLSRIGRALSGVWWLLDSGRRALLNLLLLFVVLALVWAALHRRPGHLQDRTTLVLELSGRIAEQRAGSSRALALGQLRGQASEQTRLRDVLAVLDAAARDAQVTQALLLLDGLEAAGLPTLHEVAGALDRFKAAGKPVIAWGPGYDQRQLFLAARASEVWLDPMGSVEVEGYGRERNYYKDLLDRLGLSANVIRAGKFKNFAETYTANEPSAATLEAEGLLLNTLWGSWTGGVESARKLPAGSIAAAVASLPASLAAAAGDRARWALEHHWVDALRTRDEMRSALIERGAADGEHKTFRQVGFDDYLRRIKPRSDGDAVGVIVAEGEISDGRSGPGRIGGLSTAELVRQAREDDQIKALVLRVDSPGGSVFGSELVRRELALARKAGKPVVVSMGDVAASGGYWIATAADEIIADEATVTGSIGVIAMLPRVRGALEKLGVHSAGVTTTWLAGAYDLQRSLDPRLVEMVQAVVDHDYLEFTGLVATARKAPRERIDAVAQGRVWAGKDALAQGLVDRLGSLDDAVQAAARRAHMVPDPRVQYVEAEGGRLERLLQGLGLALQDLAGPFPGLTSALQALAPAWPGAAETLADLDGLAQQAGRRPGMAVMAHCLCVAP
jgi:protease-4